MPTLWAASLRHLVRHPAQLALALVALAAGVATIVAVDIATASSRRAFELSMRAVNGPATQVITGGPRGLDEALYVRLVMHQPLSSAPEPVFAPVIEGYVTIGGRVMQLAGVDPFASGELEGPQARALSSHGSSPEPDELRSWFAEPGAVVMAADSARQLGLRQGSRFTLEIGGVRHPAVLIGLIRTRRPGDATLILTDIAQAQEWLGLRGRLTRIDVRTPAGAAGQGALVDLQRGLPPGVQLEAAAGHTRETLDMSSAFSTNLTAMSLLALLVSALLIYGAVSFTVVQRRRSIAILRALGATRGEILTVVLTEAAALGAAGAALGVLLGVAVGHELVKLVSQTINDLYYVVAVQQVTLPARTIIGALAAGIGTALIAGLLPALEVAGSTPQLGLRRSALESRAALIARRLSWLSIAFALTACALIAGSSRSVFAGFAALFLLLSSVAALTPSVLRALARRGAKSLAGITSVGRLALEDVAVSLSRTGVAVAALAMAVAAMIGVSIMVESFRVSLRQWLAQTMRADIYVAAPGPGMGRPERRIEPAVLQALLMTPGVADHSASRSVVVHSARGEIALDALQLAPGSYAGIDLTAGDSRTVWSAYDRGALLLSDSLAWRLHLRPGESLSLVTPSGSRDFPIAGVYREYGSGLGSAMMSFRIYRQLWQDDAVTAVGLYLGHGVDAAGEIPRLQAATADRQALLIRSNADIRSMSLAIFDRTFIITRVLYWLAAAIAAIGLVSALLAWELDRAREMSLLRALGLTPRGAAALIEVQTLFMGGAALLAALPAGLIIAVVLTKIIDRRAFGWHIGMHLHAAQFVNALALALAAALLAGLYPAWRTARAPIAAEMREE
ncbi:MAG TPA: FtsX-like permease family protein [Steroidobacteraceae bacterium]|nr:FtsX-like permease family protein [Steroidobacteraceae bacterium]